MQQSRPPAWSCNPQSQDKAMTEAFWKDTQVLGGLFAGLKDPMLALCWISRREYRSHPGNCADFGLSLPEVYMNSSNTIFVQVLDCPCLKKPRMRDVGASQEIP